MYLTAFCLAEELFKNKRDKGGNLYLEHLKYVADQFHTEDEKIIAMLHDILEDTKITIDDLRKLGFKEQIINSIKILTKNENEEYLKYIDRIIDSNDEIAIKVKMVDIKNNMDLTRIPNPTKEDEERVEIKYKPSYAKLIQKMGDMENDRYKVNKGK